jgi:topoisomerase IA-like protein
MAKYGKKAQAKVKEAMEERKAGTLKSGRSGKKVTNRKQAIAIGLSEAREEGAKVPRKKTAKKAAKKTAKKSAAKKAPAKKSAKKARKK